LKNIIDRSKTVRQVEKAAKRVTPKKRRKKELPLIYQNLREELMEIFKTEVNINLGKKKNKLTIEFYSDEDLTRIYNIIRGNYEEQ